MSALGRDYSERNRVDVRPSIRIDTLHPHKTKVPDHVFPGQGPFSSR